MNELATINVNKSDGTSEKMMIITIFENNNKMYMIYKSMNNEKYYGALVNVDNDNLDTNLSVNEKKMMNNVFRELKLGGEYNA